MIYNRLNRPAQPDDVEAPLHYTSTMIPAIEVIEDWELNFQLGTVLKYIARHRHKGGVQDLRKAKWYLEREIIRWEKSINEQSKLGSAKSLEGLGSIRATTTSPQPLDE